MRKIFATLFLFMSAALYSQHLMPPQPLSSVKNGIEALMETDPSGAFDAIILNRYFYPEYFADIFPYMSKLHLTGMRKDLQKEFLRYSTFDDDTLRLICDAFVKTRISNLEYLDINDANYQSPEKLNIFNAFQYLYHNGLDKYTTHFWYYNCLSYWDWSFKLSFPGKHMPYMTLVEFEAFDRLTK